MIKKELLIGFAVGVIANAFGFLLALIFFGYGLDLASAINTAMAEQVMGKLISLGALLNLVAFFGFLKIKREYRARGVIFATIAITMVTFLINFS